MPEDKGYTEDKNKKLDPIAEYKKLTDARNFKTANTLYTIARENEKFDIGIQHDGENTKNLTKATYNFIGQTNGIKNASILANELGMLRSSDAIDEDNEKVQKAIKAFNMADKKNWERLKMDAMNEQLVYDASIQGLGVSYWYWDDKIESGNTFVVKGDINGQLVDTINLYVANPAQVNIQKQPWNKITIDMTVQELKVYARNKGVPEEQIEMIVPDEQEITYRAFEKSDTEQDNSSKGQLATLVINFEKRGDEMWKSESTKDLLIEDWKDIDLPLYPIAVFPYKPRKSFIYGEAEMTRYLENQKIANSQANIRHLHAKLMAIPKVIINENVIGSFSNAVGSINKVKLPPGTPVSNAMDYKQPTALTIDVDKSIDDAINRTQTLAGVNQNIQGAARPENAAALLTQIKQANVPLETYKRRLHKYVEDVAIIWLAFYKTKYNMTRKFKLEGVKEDEENTIEFKGTDFVDVFLNTATDVGPSTQWSEITSLQFLNDMWDRQIITDKVQYLERIPENMVKNQQGLIEEAEDDELFSQIFQMIIPTLPPEQQQAVSEMPLEEQKKFMKQMIGGQNEV